MREFFCGWRRKIGILTLVMACIFAAGWVRSLMERDALIRLSAHDTHGVVSAEGCIQWARIWPDISYGPSRWMYRHDEIIKSSSQDEEDLDVHWNLTGWGFDFRTQSEIVTIAGTSPFTREIGIWEIPYWSIVLPLILLSSYQLLRRPETPKRTTATAPEVVQGS